jgi:hypothetical protein
MPQLRDGPCGVQMTADAADEALTAFHHPYAYAAVHGAAY